MELTKTKFKQTEIGSMPEDWNIYKFDDIGDTIIGLTYKPSDVSNTGKLVHRSSNIQNNKLAYHDNVYVTCSIPEKLILREEDILICVRNGSRNLIGKSAIIQGISIGETFGAFMSVFRPKMYAPLVYQYFISNIVQSQINASLGATINQITNKTLNSFITFFPPTLKEQKAIATALSDVDALISNLDQLITKKKAIKQGAMQQLLTPPHKGGKRLAGFTGEWVEKCLGEIVEITSGESPSKFHFKDFGTPYYKVEQLNNSNKYTAETPYYIDISKGKYVIKNSIVFPKRGASIMLNKIRIFKEDSYLDTNLMALTLSEKCNHELIFYILTYQGLDKIADTTSIPQINNKHIIPYKINLPRAFDEQTAISRVLSDMDTQIEKLETKKSKYQDIKQGMMQELLKGKTRLV